MARRGHAAPRDRGRGAGDGGSPRGLRRAPRPRRRAHAAPLRPLRRQARAPRGVVPALAVRARPAAGPGRGRRRGGPARGRRPGVPRRAPPVRARRGRRQGPHLGAPGGAGADGRGGAGAGGPPEAPPGGGGGDRQPEPRGLRRGPPRPPPGGRGPAHGRPQARQRPAHRRLRRPRDPDAGTDPGGRPPGRALRQHRGAQRGLAAGGPAGLHGDARRRPAGAGAPPGRPPANACRAGAAGGHPLRSIAGPWPAISASRSPRTRSSGSCSAPP